MSDNVCFFCEVNPLDYTYNCCKKQCCQNCHERYKKINKSCPWCRQDYSILNINSNSNQNILDYYLKWIKQNQIPSTSHSQKCLNSIKIMNNIFQRQNNEIVEFQVANLNKIHVFKYHDFREISFKYWPEYQLIEIKGGDYYLYDEPRSCDVFGWWLHGFVKPLTQ